MSLRKSYNGYRSYEYLEGGTDYDTFPLAEEIARVEPSHVTLSDTGEKRVERIVEQNIMISLHEHLGVFPKDVRQTPAYIKEGRMATAFEGLSHSYWDAVFDNLMDGLCSIESKGGWKWTEVLHDLGMRLCDLAHQDFVVLCTGTDDIRRAHEEGKVAWVASIEGAAMIENELDRIEQLYGFGVRALGVTYSEANALGSGLREPRDGGLTVFGREVVERMNRVGMLIDCSHAGDQTTLDTIEQSEHPIVLSHIGARALWDSNRLAPDEVLKACAEKGGLIGIEAAPNSTLTNQHRSHGLEAYMEHFEYVKDLVGIDHVSFGPDTIYGDHIGLYQVYSSNLSLEESRKPSQNGGTNSSVREGAKQNSDTGRGMGHPPHEQIEYVRGIENPTEGSHNIVRWLVKHDYDDEEISKVLGGNALRVLDEVWK